MPSVNQFCYVPNTTNYVWGAQGAIPNIPITGAPADTDFRRFAMLHDGTTYRMYFFKVGTNNKLYQFAWDGTSYAYSYNSIPIITLTNIPADADMTSFAMLHDGVDYCLYVRRLYTPNVLYQAKYVPNSTTYEFGATFEVTGFPADTDWCRWSMLHDGAAYRIYTMKLGSNTHLYQGSYKPATQRYEYGHFSIPILNIVNTPLNSNVSRFAMLYGQNLYHLYFQTL